MKKIFTLLTLLSVLLSTIPFAFASDLSTDPTTPELNTLKAYAYLDLETADSEMQEVILNARNEMILSTAWVADGASAYIVDTNNNNNNITEEIPEFSEIFPEDWELPTFSSDTRSIPSTPQISPLYTETIFSGSVKLSVPSNNYNTPSFLTVAVRGFVGTAYEYYAKSITTHAVYSNNGTYAGTYNLGYSDSVTGVSLGWVPKVNNGNSCIFYPPSQYNKINLRASTFDTPASWTFNVVIDRVDLY